MTAAPKRVLIHRLGSLGDTLITLPVFHLLNRLWPDAAKRVLTNFPVQSKAPPLQTVAVVHLRVGAVQSGRHNNPHCRRDQHPNDNDKALPVKPQVCRV